MIPIIDVSKWQGDIDWRKVAASGIPGVIIRAGNGSTIDIRTTANINGARAAGILVGVYWFCNPKAALVGAQQGQLLGAAHQRHGCELPPMWDVERYSDEAGPNPVLVGAPMARWLAEFVAEADTVRFSLGYSGASYWNTIVAPGRFDIAQQRFTDQWRADLEYLNDHDFILARYPGWHRLPDGTIVDFLPRGVDPRGWADVAMLTGRDPPPLTGRTRSWDGWQWSAGGNAQGSRYGMQSSDLDLNIVKDEAWQRWTQHEPAPIPPQGQDADMAVKLTNRLAGKYGNRNESWWVLMDDGTKRHIPTIEELAARTLNPTQECDDEVLDAIPDWHETGAGGITDEVARQLASTANAAIARVGQDLGDVKMYLGHAGEQH